MYLRGAECILHCNHKPLEPFLSKGIKNPLTKPVGHGIGRLLFNIHSHIGQQNILADAISMLKMLGIYRDPTEDPKMLKASNLKQHVTKVNINKIHTLNNNVLCAEQKWDITCKKFASQSHVTCVPKFYLWQSVPKKLEIPQSPMAVLAIDTTGHFQVMSKKNSWTLTAICLHTHHMSLLFQ